MWSSTDFCLALWWLYSFIYTHGVCEVVKLGGLLCSRLSLYKHRGSVDCETEETCGAARPLLAGLGVSAGHYYGNYYGKPMR